jgi:hypothetical protein
MPQHSDVRWPVFRRVRRRAAGVARRGLLPVTVVVLAAVGCVALGPRALSSAGTTPGAASSPAPSAGAAPNTLGMSWEPVGVSQNATGNCWVEFDGSEDGSSATPAAGFQQEQAALADASPFAVNEDGLSSITLSTPSNSGNGLAQPLTARAGVDCSILNQTDAYLRQAGGGRLAGPVQATLDAYTFSWAKAALADLAGLATYAAVYAAVVAGVVALTAETGPGALVAAQRVAPFAGCLAGAAAGAVINAVYTGTFASLDTLGHAITGCIASFVTGVLMSAPLRPWVARAIGAALGIHAPALNIAVTAAQAEAVAMATMGPIGAALMTAAGTVAIVTALNDFLVELGLQ